MMPTSLSLNRCHFLLENAQLQTSTHSLGTSTREDHVNDLWWVLVHEISALENIEQNEMKGDCQSLTPHVNQWSLFRGMVCSIMECWLVLPHQCMSQRHLPCQKWKKGASRTPCPEHPQYLAEGGEGEVGYDGELKKKKHSGIFNNRKSIFYLSWVCIQHRDEFFHDHFTNRAHQAVLGESNTVAGMHNKQFTQHATSHQEH